ncbi:Lrp/AsnC family transcriptional regulator, partial [Nanoarchaeota archaeon]
IYYFCIIENMKLDLKDKRLIYELDKNARQPLSKLAKKVRLSQQAVGLRLKNLVDSGVIKKFITIINTAKLGYLSYRVYVRYQNVNPEKEKEIIDSLLKNSNVFWFASLSGRWDLEVLMFARNFFHFNQIWNAILNKHGKYIGDHTLSMATYNYHFKRRYLVKDKEELPDAYYGGEPETIKLDKVDVQILKLLATDARIPIIDLGKKIKLASNTVKYRIKRLEKLGIIQTYRLWLDTSKLGYELHKALITTQNLNEFKEKKIISFCKNILNTLYVIRCAGPWDIELEFEVLNNEEYRKIMMDFRNLFSDIIKDYETLIIYKEHKINYFPMNV